ncbi:MAG: hypothetical protein Ct9H300mP32_3020 [Verrucomicrobiota bacterium]|nr:MAG: hypothetical protein Ct9H300mP32_3020 [Verrucomicrobiota bacterium]
MVDRRASANQVGAKTLFATHYHELTELPGPGCLACATSTSPCASGTNKSFPAQDRRGRADKSYGFPRRRLAGVPKPVIERAKAILQNLEDTELSPDGGTRYVSRQSVERKKLRQIEPAHNWISSGAQMMP